MKELKHQPRTQSMTHDQSKRTKPLPPDPEKLNANRARWAAIVLAEFQRQTGSDAEDAVSDLLADLMHWCDRFGQDFNAELRRARNHYGAETATTVSNTGALASDNY